MKTFENVELNEKHLSGVRATLLEQMLWGLMYRLIVIVQALTDLTQTGLCLALSEPGLMNVTASRFSINISSFFRALFDF